jgi:hypothetical protein
MDMHTCRCTAATYDCNSIQEIDELFSFIFLARDFIDIMGFDYHADCLKYVGSKEKEAYFRSKLLEHAA